jgi:DNA-binding transcriptional LysR family regulator
MRPQELNLLMVFDAIMTERSITRASERLSMTQPAVSNAVSRMRASWKDELFVKDGRNIQPTVYAQNLWNQIKQPLAQLNDAVDPNIFDPTTSTRTFRVAVADIIVDAAWVPLREIIKREAPGVNIHAIPYTFVNAEEVLKDAKVDIVIGAADAVPSSIHTEFLLSPHFVCVMAPDHPLNKGPLSVEAFANAEHLFISLSGDINNDTDKKLAEYGLSRRIALTVNHFSAVPPIVAGSDLLCIAPSSAVINAIIDGTLAGAKPPIDIAAPRVSLLWHKRQNRDSGLAWLRGHLKQIITDEAKKQEQALSHFCKMKCSKAG